MKNTRRLIAGIVTLTMVSAMAPVNAFATENIISLDDSTSSGSTDVKYSVEPSYTVVIPASITLSDTSAINASISVDETATPFKLGKDQKLSVNIADVDTNDFKVTNADQSLDYTVTAGTSTTALTRGSTAAEFTNDDKEPKVLTFSQMDASEANYAGDYTGTLTFDIAVESFVPVTSLNVNGNINLGIGGTHTVTATVNPQNATNKTLEWEKNRDDVDLNVSEDTLSCTITGNNAGHASVTVRTTDGSGLYETFVVVIEPPAP